MVRINGAMVEDILDAVERGELDRMEAWDRLYVARLPQAAIIMRLDAAEDRRDREG